jgi:hypothetical protein
MRSRGIISEKIFLLVRHFSDISLFVRVKTLILSFILKNAPIKRRCFSKFKVLYSRTKEVLKYGSIE